MDHSTSSNTHLDCSHLNYVYDYHEGNEVCLSCGLVSAPLFIFNSSENTTFLHNESSNKKLKIQEIEDILDMIHISRIYSNFIYKYFCKNFKIWNRRTTVFCIFKVLNDMNCPISMKELGVVTNVEKKKMNSAQPSNQNVEVNFGTVAEKYCQLLKIPYKTISVIKEEILKAPMTGHNPNSIIASVIYNRLKTEKKKISLKTISKLTNVSCISIQRYNKILGNVNT
jgi:transcription initiation factor TFIIIB Brf1 subunit/transcription initiation factor TFIIB